MRDKIAPQVHIALTQSTAPSVLVHFKSCAQREAFCCALCADPALDVQHEFRALPMAAMRVSPSGLRELERSADVDRVWLDAPVRAQLDTSIPIIRVDAVRTNYGHTGEGILVAVLDTGIDASHPDFAGRIAGNADFSEAGIGDVAGHGTHVASILAGDGAASGGLYRGVAPGASLLVAKVLDDAGEGVVSRVIAGMSWAIANGARVINMSLSTDDASDGTDALSVACDEVTDLGVLVVVSAGNTGPGAGTIGSPSASVKALTVGAASDADAVASFSSRGPTLDGRAKPDVLAPGVAVIGARASGVSFGTTIDAYYAQSDGTSSAAPHVAGLAALMLQARPELPAAGIKELVMRTSRSIGADLSAQGFGRIDAAAAFLTIGTQMTIRLSTGLCTLLMTNSGLQRIMQYGVIDLYAGEQPFSADAAPLGTHVARITQDGLTFVPGSFEGGLYVVSVLPGELIKYGTWTLKGIASGTATWFRWKGNAADDNQSSQVLPRLDGRIGADMSIETAAITAATQFNIQAFSVVQPSI